MSTTTDKGWSKGWPENGTYWRRGDENDTPQLVRIRGAAYRLIEKGTSGLRGEHINSGLAAVPRDPDTFEYLGPISPSDFEQLAALREIAGRAANWIEAQTWPCQHSDQPMRCTRCATRAKAKELVAALREALKGEKS